MDAPQFRLNPALDRDRLARAYGEQDRLHIPDFLEAGDAEHLLAALQASADWKLILNQGDRIVELDRRMQAGLSPEQKMRMNAAVLGAAQHGFQYRYETIKAPHADADRSANPTPLNAFARFMSSEEVLAFVRHVTGAADITFADADPTSTTRSTPPTATSTAATARTSSAAS